MNQANSEGLYGALESVLKAAKEPMDCHALFEMHEVREYAETVNRVSDYLGNMWRKGQVIRVPAPKLSGYRSRWLYAWKGKKALKPTLDDIKKGAVVAEDYVNSILRRPNMEITQEGRKVIITLAGLTITIDQA